MEASQQRRARCDWEIAEMRAPPARLSPTLLRLCVFAGVNRGAPCIQSIVQLPLI
jgi:hypothetical protein